MHPLGVIFFLVKQERSLFYSTVFFTIRFCVAMSHYLNINFPKNQTHKQTSNKMYSCKSKNNNKTKIEQF